MPPPSAPREPFGGRSRPCRLSRGTRFAAQRERSCGNFLKPFSSETDVRQRSCRRVWGGASVKDRPLPEAKSWPEKFLKLETRKRATSCLNRVFAFETHRWKSVGGPQSREQGDAGRRLNASQTPARAVTTSGQLSLGSLCWAEEERASKPGARLWSADAWARSEHRRATWRTSRPRGVVRGR